MNGTRIAVAMAALLLSTAPGGAETIHIARQFGISYLPIILMRHDHLLEQESKARGLDLDVQYLTFTGGPPINDAMISGNVDIATGGVGAMLTLWGKTHGNLKVKGLATLGNMPIWLTTSNPAVKTIADFTEQDRIALPGVKVSIQAVVLQMAARQAFGPGQEYRLDPLTVTMGHPDAEAALLSGRSQVTAHFGSAPYMYEELENPNIHRVLNSYDVLGGPHTFNLSWTTVGYHDAHPKVVAAFMAALERAMQEIVQDPLQAATVWVAEEHSRLTPQQAADIVRRSENEWTTTPKGFTAFMGFMHDTGVLPQVAESWKDLFFPEGQGGNGS